MVIRRRLGWTAHFAPRPLAAVLIAVALCASGCSSDDELSAGDAATVAEGSRAEYVLDGGEWTAVGEGEIVPEGATVRPVGDEAALMFRDGTVRLSADASAVVTGDRVTVDRGEALIFSSGDLGGAVEDTTVGGEARYRLSSGLSARVGVYDGAVTVRRPAQERSVNALRELDLSAFRLGVAEPLHYAESDAWDQELLRTAIAFDGEAARLTRGMDVDLGRRPLAPRFYRQFTQRGVIDVLAAHAATSRGGAFGPPSDVLLTVFVAEAAPGDAVEPVVRVVTDLRADGARWGLIAVELDVASQQVVAAIDDLDGGRIAAAEKAARRRGDRADAKKVAAAAGGDAAGSSDATAVTATDTPSGEDTTSTTATPPKVDDRGDDPGDTQPPKDPGDKDPGDNDPGDGPGEPEEPTLQESVEKVVSDVVGSVDTEDLPDLPVP